MNIEILYFEGCPNYADFVMHLEALLREHGMTDPLHHIRVESSEQARESRFLGSPTVRFDGIDVEPGAADRTHYGMQCRLYRSAEGYQSTPPDQWIVDAMARFEDG